MAEPLGKLLLLFDRVQGAKTQLRPRWLFLRVLGLIYFSAFLALAFQVLGLNGSKGILPAAGYLRAVHELGAMRFWFAPTLLWLGASDHALLALVWAGLLASVLVALNLAPRAALAVCWLCFLSWVAVSQDFGQYQSDGMLLEAGLLAFLIAPSGLRPGLGASMPGVRVAYFLLLWEWFRIYFESGVVKLRSGDPTWRHLTAMVEYYQNGPLPTWVGWYLQHLPLLFHKATALLTLVLELGLVFLAFLPRPWRLACFAVATVWQIGVIATANYAFLNYLVLALGFFLLDDTALQRFLPFLSIPAVPAKSGPEVPSATGARRTLRRHPREVLRALRIALTAVLLTTMLYGTLVPLLQMFVPQLLLPASPMAVLEPFRVANTYGLFATMTPHRYEIEFQGSNDGQTWTAYPFRFKSQNLHARPRIYAPFQPRFDWNLWFASLTSWDRAPIVPRTELRLLEGSPETLSLFRSDPFPNAPPRYVRAVLYQYWFSTPQQKRAEGVWWTRRLLGTYAPTLTRQPDGRFAAVALPELQGPPPE